MSVLTKARTDAAAIASPNSAEGHEATLLTRFLNDETAVHRYPDLKPEHFASPIHREIYEAILRLHYDGHDANFIALQDYFRGRGKLEAIGKHTLSTLAADSRIAALDNNCCDYARDVVIDAYVEREAARIYKAASMGEIAFAEVRDRLNKLTPPAREPERPLIEFRSPLQLKNFMPPPGLVLAGDFHIVKGSVFVIGGAAGIGKSRAAVALGVAGATQSDWFGLKVHRRFKVLICQSENGEFRLARDFAELDCEMLEDFVRVCPPPPYGLCFQRNDFREQLAAAIAEFQPDVVVYDPLNAIAREQDSAEYLTTFDALKSVLPLGDDAPALGVVCHTRKPKTDERASGRALLNLLAGSYVLGSVPRTAFVMHAASDDTTALSGLAAKTMMASLARVPHGNVGTDCLRPSWISIGRRSTRRIGTAAKRLQRPTLPKCSRTGRSRKPKPQNGCKRTPARARRPLTGRSILMAASKSTCSWRKDSGCGNERALCTVCLMSHCP